MPYTKKPIMDWQGVNNFKPGIALPPNSFKQLLNWVINKGRLYPFPRLGDFPEIPSSDTKVLGMRTFQDQLGNYHTVILNQEQPFYLNADGTYNQLTDPDSNLFSPTSNSFFSLEVMLNRCFFANGGAPLAYVIGDQNFYYAGDLVASGGGSCYFLGKLASHLMLVNCVEPVVGTLGSTAYPSRVRWSASGNPFEYDSSVDPTTGFLDIADVEDQLTGWATIGTNGFAFRNNGITAFSPTGNEALPFYLENFSIGPQGVGASIPYTLASYGPFCVFVALDDIYFFDGNAPQPIGRNAKKAIFAEIDQANAPVFATVQGTLLGGTDFLSYWLHIPQPLLGGGFTSTWVYHFDSQTWTNIHLPYGAATAMQNVAGLPGPPTIGWGYRWGQIWGSGA